MENWVQWMPLAGLTGRWYVGDKLITSSSLILTIVDEPGVRKIRLFFENCIQEYRYVNESFALPFPSGLIAQYGDQSQAAGRFFKVFHSKYVSSVIEQYHADPAITYIHFCIIGVDEIVDIIAISEPIITII